MEQDIMAKCVGIQEFHGSGKTQAMLYISLYAVRFFFVNTPVMKTYQYNLDEITCITSSVYQQKNIYSRRMADISILEILKDYIKLNNLMKLDVLLCDEMGQLPAKFVSVIDIIPLLTTQKQYIYLSVTHNFQS